MSPGEGTPLDFLDTRLCVKNLPKHCDGARLREHFAARGEVTDAKILRTRCEQRGCASVSPADVQGASDGRSRQIAFVGFKTAAQASEAVRYFNRSFMDTSRLEVAVRLLLRALRPPSRHPSWPARQDRRPPGRGASTAQGAPAMTVRRLSTRRLRPRRVLAAQLRGTLLTRRRCRRPLRPRCARGRLHGRRLLLRAPERRLQPGALRRRRRTRSWRSSWR